ncbi:hypothetical protein BGX27_001064 [Mortierella sp. AM989]|nr:hypothetical protein BGX27_001064 [Mortierella sp. AM989]
MANSSAQVASISQGTAYLSLDAAVVSPVNSTQPILSQDHNHHNINGHSFPLKDAPAARNPEQRLDSFNGQPSSPVLGDHTQRQHGLNHPQLDYIRPLQEHNNPQMTNGSSATRDAWADQGHFPLILGEISCTSFPARGGSRILLSGVNFREGVEVVFECPKLGKAVETRVITPRVLKSTEIEFITPNLLDWWTAARRDHSCKQLELSVSLTCAGVRNEEDIDTAFNMTALEDSESELLHIIIELHRQQIKATIKNSGSSDPEAERIARQRTLTLLNLERPQSVSLSEHMALSVIYMLCDGHDQISDEGMGIIKSTTEDGHEALHLAVIQSQTTLVREIARHLLGWYRAHPITSESEIFLKNRNGETALDFAKTLGLDEIEQVLKETSEAANEFKRSVYKALPQPLSTSQIGSTAGNNENPRISASSSIPGHSLNRPLPPTPENGSYQESGSYFSAGSSHSGMTGSPTYSPVQSTQTVHTTIEGNLEPSYTVHENPPSHTNITEPDHTLSPEQQHASYNQYIPPHSDPLSHTPHNIPSHRVNSLPVSQSTGNPQSEQPQSRPPLTSSQSAAPPLPPRHKVTRVNRPKQFTIPSPETPQTQGQSPSIPHAYAPPLPQHEQYHSLIVQPAPLPQPFHQPMPTPAHPYPAHLPMPTHQPPTSMPMYQPPSSGPMHYPQPSMPMHHPPPSVPMHYPSSPMLTHQYPGLPMASMPMQHQPIPAPYSMPIPPQQYLPPMVMVRSPDGQGPDSHIKVRVE